MPLPRYPFLSIFFLLLLAAFTGFGQENRSKKNTSTRVMTYNIRLATKSDSVNYWPNRKALVAGLINYHRPDLLGVQEALPEQMDELEQLLPQFSYYGVGRDDGKRKGEFSAIFYRKDRFKLLDAGTFWLSETPEVPGSKSWDAAITRICSWVKFRDRQTKKTFYHFNTHYDHIGEQARENSSHLVVQRLKGMAGNLPVVITGDFNVPATASAYTTLVNGTGIRDAQELSEIPPYGPNQSFNGFKFCRMPSAKIDFIFVRTGIRVKQHAVLTDSFENRYPSDHFPVLAEIELP